MLQRFRDYSDLTFIDVETTGLSPSRDRIIEIGLLRMKNGRVTKTFSSLINPEASLPPEITLLTGITADQLESAPTFSSVSKELRALLDGALFVAHNARFDYSFVKAEFARLDTTFSSELLCTAKLSRALFPRFKKHNLDSIIARFGFSCEVRHRAFSDAKVLVDFWKTVQKQFGEETLVRAITSVTKSSSLPATIGQDAIKNLPESPGVYLFYGTNGAPLYIGKSINIRERVRSHFYEYAHSTKEANIFRSIRSIEYRKTSGELGALLLESQLIKEYQPMHNRMLRKPNAMIAVYKTTTTEGYDTVIFKELSTIVPEEIQGILAIYRTRGHMKTSLRELCYKHALCQKLMGLEKTDGRCFGSQIEACHGACVGEEAAYKYNMRVTEAFHATRIKQWPFSGPIGIVEAGKLHVVTMWCYLGMIAGEHELDEILDQKAVFDYDTYKILSRHLLHKARDSSITLLNQHTSKYEGE